MLDAQIIVFCVTAMLTKFYAELFQSLGSPVLEIHSRKSQSARTKAADAFRVGSQASCRTGGDIGTLPSLSKVDALQEGAGQYWS